MLQCFYNEINMKGVQMRRMVNVTSGISSFDSMVKDAEVEMMRSISEKSGVWDSMAFFDLESESDRQETMRMVADALVVAGESDEFYDGRYAFLSQINFAALARQVAKIEFDSLASGKLYKWSVENQKRFFSEFVVPIIKRRFVVVNSHLYFRTDWAYWMKLPDSCRIREIVELICFMLPSVGIIRGSNAQNACVEMFENATDVSIPQDEPVIQFDDCVFIAQEGCSQRQDFGFPRYFFNRRVWDAIQAGKPSNDVPEVEDLLLHLANGDEDVKQCLIERLAMAFIASVSKKRQLGAKAVMLYGPTAENGKSTFADLLERAFGYENVDEFVFGEFERYELCKLKSNLLLIDKEASNVHVTGDVAATIKKAITADSLPVREIYKAPETVTPLTQFVVCTNGMPKAEDKTHGWDRRLEWFEVDEKLVKDSAWHDVIKSKKAADYLFEKLLIEADNLTKKSNRIETPKKLSDSNASYNEVNRNVLTWLKSLEEEQGKPAAFILDRCPAGKAYEDYESWCMSNGETPFGRTNFNAMIKAETKLVNKQVKLTANGDREAFAWWVQSDEKKTTERMAAKIAVVKCWSRA